MVADKKGGRPRPVAIEGDIHKTEVDTVISAIGQGANYDFLPEEIKSKIEFKWGKVLTNKYCQTSEPKIFAGGDIRNSTADAVSAIADGHLTAKGIDDYFNSRKS